MVALDGEGILESDYNTRYASMFRSRQQRDRKYDRTRAQQDKLRESTIYGMITGKILALEAEEQGLAELIQPSDLPYRRQRAPMV